MDHHHLGKKPKVVRGLFCFSSSSSSLIPRIFVNWPMLMKTILTQFRRNCVFVLHLWSGWIRRKEGDEEGDRWTCSLWENSFCGFFGCSPFKLLSGGREEYKLCKFPLRRLPVVNVFWRCRRITWDDILTGWRRGGGGGRFGHWLGMVDLRWHS